MEHGSIIVAGISITFLLLALTYFNVYTLYRMRRKHYEYYREKQQWASFIIEDRDRLIGEVERDIHDNIGQLTHRSEEHTSELQSLMRISYAVFFLKKNK